MQRRIAILSVLMCAVLVVPSVTATWRALGSFEPDTEQDRDDGFMFLDPNWDNTAKKVYFNVVSTQYLTATNPNMALEGGRVLSSPTYTLEAFYGVWIDCNLDGYIGMADTAMMEYRSELLPSNHICPDTGNTAAAGNLHNQQSWVSELRWIGPPGGADGNDADDLPDGRDNRLVKDPFADIWGDNNLPGTPIAVSEGSSCFLLYHRTGQVMNYLDCYLATNAGQGLDGANGALTEVGLGFAPDGDGETNYDQAHPLNVDTLGDDDAEQRAATVWDCDGGRQGVATGLGEDQGVAPMETGVAGYKTTGVQYTDDQGELNVSVYDETNTNGTSDRNNIVRRDVTYFAPTVPSTGPGTSIAGAWNHTSDGATGDCDPNTGAGTLYGSETQPDVRVPGKASVSFEFTFFEEQRSGAGKRGEPFDRGVYPGVRAGLAVIFQGHRWFGGNYAGNSPYLVRDDLSGAGPRYFTFYANMTQASIDQGVILASPAAGVYGAEWCGSATFGVINGFNCNPDEWYIDAKGDRLTGRDNAVFAGHEYQVRDIDCYDYRAAEGVYLSGGMVDPNARCVDP